MKLIIQIPCKNEKDNLEVTLRDLPTKIPGVDTIETLIVDDGSSDGTTQKAIELGVDHVLRFEANRGLAKTFASAIKFSRALGADIIVHTDADNQYQGKYITDLAQEALSGSAGMVIGARDIDDIVHFSKTKKILQRLGSKFISVIAGFDVSDAPSGFRAYTNLTASELTVLSRYTYTLETLVQARVKGIKVKFIPIKTNPKLRESRLMKSTMDYLLKSAKSLIAIALLYEPFWIGAFGTALAVAFAALCVPVYFYSTTLAAIIAITGINLFFGGWVLFLLFQMINTHRIQNENAHIYMEPTYSPLECAKRLGAHSYYRKGEGSFTLTTR